MTSSDDTLSDECRYKDPLRSVVAFGTQCVLSFHATRFYPLGVSRCGRQSTMPTIHLADYHSILTEDAVKRLSERYARPANALHHHIFLHLGRPPTVGNDSTRKHCCSVRAALRSHTSVTSHTRRGTLPFASRLKSEQTDPSNGLA